MSAVVTKPGTVAAAVVRRPQPGLVASLQYLIRRQLQLVAMTGVLATPFLCVAFILYLYKSPLTARYFKVKIERYLLLLYIAWMVVVDRNTPSRGGRPRQWMRRFPVLWPLFREYFPARLIREQPTYDTSNGQTYVIGIHPHGIWSVGSAANIISDNNALPGINYRLCTISHNFRVPVWREFMVTFCS